MKSRPICLALLVFCLFSITSLSSCLNNNQSQKKDSLVIGMKLAPTNLDIRQTAGAALERVLLDNVYETLFSIDDIGKPVAHLVKKYNVSSDSKTYTFELYPNLKFSNNVPITASDFKRCLEQTKADAKVQSAKGLSTIDSIFVTKNNEFSVKLKHPDPEFLWKLSTRAGIVYPDESVFPKDEYKTKALGSGPYVVSKYNGNDEIQFDYNTNYWNSEVGVNIKHISVHYFSDSNAAINALMSGSLDILTPVDSKLAGVIKANSHYKIETGEGSDKYELAFNNKNEKLSDPNVRAALREAVDNDELIAVANGEDQKIGGPITKLEPGYQDLNDIHSYNPDNAKRLLQKAGYDKTNRLKLTLTYPVAVYGPEIGNILISNFEKIDVDLTVNGVDFTTWLDKVYTKKDYELSMVDQAESHSFSVFADPDYYYNYDSKDVQNLYHMASNAKTQSEYAQFLSQAAKKVSQDSVCEWLYNWRPQSAMTTNVIGFKNNFTISRTSFASLDVL